MESKFKGTKGGWKADLNRGCKEIKSIKGIGGICTTDGRNEKEDRANALLIAAAPDLLKACIETQKFLEQQIHAS